MKSSGTKNRIFGKNLHMLVFASVLLSSTGLFAHYAFAMGQAPSTCSNRYDGMITTMTITIGHKTYNPIAHPNMTFQLQNTRSYTVTFTILTSSQISQGNSLNGSTWYDTSAPGYQLGECVNGVGPNQNVTLTTTESHPGNLAPAATQNVSWSTLTSGSVTYNIKWVNP
ncbi:MAG: hypothetical protein KGI25_05080 [Thaumarchaeota archaeon]|nr:hypothetical protein [Nitrososphaerota archaeon]